MAIELQEHFWENPALEPFRKEAQSGQFLFKQGFPASSLIVLTHGVVELVSSKDNELLVVNYLGAGNVLGEKSLVDQKLFPRFFGARAAGDVSYLEFNQNEIKKLRENSPQLLVEILEATLKITIERLSRTNRLVADLRSAKPTDRFLHLVLYFANYHGQRVAEGKEIVLNSETVGYYLDMNSFQMEQIIQDLIKKDILLQRTDTVFVVKNEDHLKKMIPRLRSELVQMDFI